MDEETRWEQANEEFMDLMNEVLQSYDNKAIIHQGGYLLSYFSHFIVSLDENKKVDFSYFFRLALKIHESDFSLDDKLAFVSKIFATLERVYPEFYSEYKKDIFS